MPPVSRASGDVLDANAPVVVVSWQLTPQGYLYVDTSNDVMTGDPRDTRHNFIRLWLYTAWR